MLDRYIKKGIPFVVYRTPGESIIHFQAQVEGEVRLLHDIEELNGQKGFVIAPFHVSGQMPIVLMTPDTGTTWPENYRPVINRSVSPTRYAPCVETYSHCFDTFISALRQKRFEKLVLSRSWKLDVPLTFSPVKAFYEACRKYRYSYVYLCHTPQTGMWLGSTPEILLSGEEDGWNTVALAGTQSLQDGKLPQVWDDKNREEQGYVSSYIRSRLHSFGIQPTESEPYPAFAGALSHLKTDFHFSLPDNKNLGDLLKLLHPTPAVCGLPKEEAYQFIRENEKYDRRYYSGFIGTLNPQGKTDLYVNLRCMNIQADALTLYAGGGLLASSELEDEWQETEKKMQTMLNLVDN